MCHKYTLVYLWSDMRNNLVRKNSRTSKPSRNNSHRRRIVTPVTKKVFNILRIFILCSRQHFPWFPWFNGAETNCRIVHNLGILLMNGNCFAIYFQQHSSYVCSDIYKFCSKLDGLKAIPWTAAHSVTKGK